MLSEEKISLNNSVFRLSSVSLDKFKEMLCFSGIDFEPTATIYNLLLYNNLGFAKLMPSFDLIDFYFINALHFSF